MHVYDTYRNMTFEGIRTESPDEIKNHPDEIIFVTTNGAAPMARSLFTQLGKAEDEYVILETVL